MRRLIKKTSICALALGMFFCPAKTSMIKAGELLLSDGLYREEEIDYGYLAQDLYGADEPAVLEEDYSFGEERSLTEDILSDGTENGETGNTETGNADALYADSTPLLSDGTDEGYARDDLLVGNAGNAASDAPEAILSEAAEPEKVQNDGPREDTEELLKQYVLNQLYEGVPVTDDTDPLSDNTEPKIGRSAPVLLDDIGTTVYNKLREAAIEIAAGQRSSTVIELTLSELGLEGKKWKASDLGVESIVVNKKISAEAMAAAKRYIYDFRPVVRTLLANCPYELYWYDKTQGYIYDGYIYNASYNSSSGEYEIFFSGSVKLSFAVADEYAVSGSAYTVNSEFGEAVGKAKTKAEQIVAAYTASSDHDKLLAYKNEICSLVSYNSSAAAGNVSYGNPWQIVWVFDENPETKVVCEGYSKAFQYLCDLTSFDQDIACISVWGESVYNGKTGNHMWNIVRMEDGKNYLADLTNCDTGAVGADDLLFLKNYSDGDLNSGYFFKIPKTGKSIQYVNHEAMSIIYSEDRLKISKTEYGHVHNVVNDAAVPASCTTAGKTAGSHCSLCDEVLTEQEIVPAWGHTEAIIPGVPATCTQAGKTEGCYCSVCQAVLTAQSTIPAKGHTVVKDAGYAATCTQSGMTEGSHCIACGAVIKAQSTIPAKGHDWSEWTTRAEATVFSAGQKERTCLSCNAVETQTINKLPIRVGMKYGNKAIANNTAITIKKTKSAVISITLTKGDGIQSVRTSNVKVAKPS